MATPSYTSVYKCFIYKSSDDTLLQTQAVVGVQEGVNERYRWGYNDGYNTGEKNTPAEAAADYFNHDQSLALGGYGYVTPRTSIIVWKSTEAGLFTGPFNVLSSAQTIYNLGGIYLKLFPLEEDIRIYISVDRNPEEWYNGTVTFTYIRNNTQYASLGWLCSNAVTIPWPEPLLQNGNMTYLYVYTLNVSSTNGKGRVYVPATVTTAVFNWPTNSNTVFNNLSTFFTGLTPIDESDPYVDIPDSEPSGPAAGTGIPDTAGIDIPSLPSVSVLDTGFVNLFNPTMAQVQSLADYMWAGLFDINTFRKIFADPMDCILGFNMVPVNVPSGSAAAVVVGNISTGVNMNVATSQWVELDCGSITLDLPYGSYLDYAPYSKVSLYLPYIGMVELSTDDVMGRTLTLKYHVDVLSCSCVAYLKCGPDVLYQFTGSCGYSIPLTGENFRQMISAVINIATNIAGAAVTGGMSAAVGAGASVAQNVMNAKPEIHRSGSIGSSAGLMGIQKAFLILELPRACKPAKQYHYTGYPGFITVTVGDLTGYAEFEDIILDGFACTSEERAMIESACKGGIYL